MYDLRWTKSLFGERNCARMASEAGICCCLYLALLLQQPDPPLTLVGFSNTFSEARWETCLKTDHRQACIRFSDEPRENSKIRGGGE